MSGGVQLVILLVVLGVFWMLMMRPARNQRRAMQHLQSNLSVGDRVVISAGIFGTVQSVDEGKVDLEIAPGTVVTVATQVVVRRADEEPTDDADEYDEDEDEPDDEAAEDGIESADDQHRPGDQAPATDEEK